MPIFQYTDHVRLWDAVIEVLKEHDPDDEFMDEDDFKHEAYAREFGKHIPLKDRPAYYCFACEYANQVNANTFDDSNRCRYCPLDWKAVSGFDHCCLNADTGLYDDFSHAVDDEDMDAAIDYAQQIRDVPVKEGVDFI